MKRIAALSLTVVSIIMMSSPTYAIPWGAFKNAAEEAAERVPRAAKGAAENAANKADDSVKGLRAEPDMLAPSTIPGKDEIPTQILENGAREAELDPEGAVKGAQQPPEEAVNSSEGTVNVLPPVPVGTAVSSVSEQGSGAALPIVGGAALAVTYGIYRAVKSRI